MLVLILFIASVVAMGQAGAGEFWFSPDKISTPRNQEAKPAEPPDAEQPSGSSGEAKPTGSPEAVQPSESSGQAKPAGSITRSRVSGSVTGVIRGSKAGRFTRSGSPESSAKPAKQPAI